MNAIFSGQEKLWKVFWIGLLIPFLVGFVAGFAAGIFHIGNTVLPVLRGTGFAALELLYIIAWSYAVFKCRNNSSSAIWKWLALLAVLLTILAHIASFAGKVNPPALTSFNPACVKTLQDFAQQNGIDAQEYVKNNIPYLRKCTKEFYTNSCLKTMEDFAKQNGMDPQEYIKQNQSYLSQCARSLEEKAEAGNH